MLVSVVARVTSLIGSSLTGDDDQTDMKADKFAWSNPMHGMLYKYAAEYVGRFPRHDTRFRLLNSFHLSER